MCIRTNMLTNLLKALILIILFVGKVNAEVLKDIIVTGNERVSSQTIINFSKIETGSDLSKNQLNDALKNIYETNFFEDVSLDINSGILNINVKEFPVIQDIEFNGIKRKKTIELLKDQISLKSRSSFNEFLLQNDLNKVKNILRQVWLLFFKCGCPKNCKSK